MRKILTVIAIAWSGGMAHAEVGFRDLIPGADFSVVERNCDFGRCYGIDDLDFSFEKKTIASGERVCSWSTGGGMAQYAKGGALYRDLTCNGRVAREEIRNTDWWPDEFDYTSSWLSSASDEQICSHAITCRPVNDRYVIGDIIVDLGPLYQGFMDLIVENDRNPYISLRTSMEEKYKVDWEFTERQRSLFNSGEISNLFISMQDGQAFINIARDINGDIRLLAEYYSPSRGQAVSSSRRPKNADMSDF